MHNRKFRKQIPDVCFPKGWPMSKHGLWSDAGTGSGSGQRMLTAIRREWNENVCVCVRERENERVTRPVWRVEDGKVIVMGDCSFLLT